MNTRTNPEGPVNFQWEAHRGNRATAGAAGALANRAADAQSAEAGEER